MGRGGGGGDRELRGAEWRGGYLRLLFVWLVSWCPGALCGLYTTRDDHRVAIHPSKSVSFSGFSGCTSNKENPTPKLRSMLLGECRLELFGS